MKNEFSESLTGSAIQIIGDHSAKSIEDQLPERKSGSEPSALQPASNQKILQIDPTSQLSPKNTLAVVVVVIMMIAGLVGTYLYNNKPWLLILHQQ